jgi:Na+/proline symporter
MISSLTPVAVVSIIAVYFILLLLISHFTGKDANNANFFLAKRSSPWYLVAIGMVGATLSGVTFISIPGVVGREGLNTNYSYMQMVWGYLFGYMIIAHVLLPIYYRYQLTSIYGFLEHRLGWAAYKTGSAFFILSRIVGASFRLFLVATVLQVMLMDAWNVPFWVTVVITIALIWTYTFRGGIRTIVITDTLQTVFMLLAVVMSIWSICNALDIGLFEIWPRIKGESLGQIFYFENGWSDPNNFFKQVLSGALITIVMTGLDQDMMQKNLTCKSLPDAQKNMLVFSGILVLANLIFITMGALLYIYAQEMAIALPEQTDRVYPMLAMSHLPAIVGILFLIGLLAAAYSSADSALTSLTTAFCIDFLNFEKRTDLSETGSRRLRLKVHVGFSLLLAILIILFDMLNSGSVINDLFKAAGYTYGPILALFCFAMWFRRSISPTFVFIICLVSPIISYILNTNSTELLGGFEFGFLILPLNALITFIGLYLFSKPKVNG